MALSENRTANQKVLTASNDALEECSICYDPFTNKAFASDCLHNFCYQCIYTWVQLRATCPLCLQPITAIIKNVRSIDDYDIEQVAPPQIDVFADYQGDIDMDMADDVFGYDYDSDIDDESISMASDHDEDLYEDISSDDIENLQSVPQSSQESLSQINIFDAYAFDDDEEYGTDEGEEEDEVSENPFTENFVSSSEDEKDDDENGDNDENDENHSENGEYFEDYEDEDNDFDDNNNEDDFEEDGSENYGNFSDSYVEDDDEDFDRSSLPRYSFSSECDSEERSQDQGYVLSNFSDFDDSDSDPDTSSPFTASYVYSCDYY